jgi:hypothetical protein
MFKYSNFANIEILGFVKDIEKVTDAQGPAIKSFSISVYTRKCVETQEDIFKVRNLTTNNTLQIDDLVLITGTITSLPYKSNQQVVIWCRDITVTQNRKPTKNSIVS